MQREFGKLALIVLFSSGIFCGGYNTDLARHGGAYFDPEAVLPGKRIGHLLVRDRNGNVKGGARLERQCLTKNRMEGECRTRLLGGNVEIPAALLKYTIYHEDNLDVTVKFESPLESHTGMVHGDNLILLGEKNMPGTDTKLTVETRFHKMPGSEGVLMQFEYFSRWGIRVGSMITTWVPAR